MLFIKNQLFLVLIFLLACQKESILRTNAPATNSTGVKNYKYRLASNFPYRGIDTYKRKDLKTFVNDGSIRQPTEFETIFEIANIADIRYCSVSDDIGKFRTWVNCEDIWPIHLQPSEVYSVKATILNIRNQPNSKAKVIGKLSKGMLLYEAQNTGHFETIDGQESIWLKIESPYTSNYASGYVYAGYISDESKNIQTKNLLPNSCSFTKGQIRQMTCDNLTTGIATKLNVIMEIANCEGARDRTISNDLDDFLQGMESLKVSHWIRASIEINSNTVIQFSIRPAATCGPH